MKPMSQIIRTRKRIPTTNISTDKIKDHLCIYFQQFCTPILIPKCVEDVYKSFESVAYSLNGMVFVEYQ